MGLPKHRSRLAVSTNDEPPSNEESSTVIQLQGTDSHQQEPNYDEQTRNPPSWTYMSEHSLLSLFHDELERCKVSVVYAAYRQRWNQMTIALLKRLRMLHDIHATVSDFQALYELMTQKMAKLEQILALELARAVTNLETRTDYREILHNCMLSFLLPNLSKSTVNSF
jgi:hypothetical protein